jgi:hypothetical protein
MHVRNSSAWKVAVIVSVVVSSILFQRHAVHRIVVPILPSHLKRCSGNHHAVGNWKLHNKSHHRTVPCCSWDERLVGLNSEEYCIPSEFVKNNQSGYAGPARGLAYSGGHSCACSDSEYEYVPDSCVLAEWNASVFCGLLGARNVLFIGDSTMEQTASALMSSVVFGSGHCQSQLTFVPGDTLIATHLGVLNRGQHWMDSVAQYQPDIVVLSTGGHIARDQPSGTFEAIVDSVIAGHAQRFPRVKLIWRSQFPGGCRDRPLVRRPNRTSLDTWRAFAASEGVGFNYLNLSEWDLYARDRFFHHNQHFLDLSPLYLRPDAHVGSRVSWASGDCLHFCQSVISDLVPRLFLHLLRDL